MYPLSQIQPQNSPIRTTTLATHIEYVKILRMLEKDIRPLGQIPGSSSYAYVIKGALGMAISVARGNVPCGLEPARQAVCLACIAARGGLLAVELEIMNVDHEALANRVGRVSGLKLLATDWLPKYCNAITHEAPLDQAAVLAVVLTGCRPSEVSKIGCTLKEGYGLVLSIPTAKTGVEPGERPFRHLIYPLVGLAQCLTKLLPPISGDPIQPFTGINTKRVTHLIGKVSARAFGSCAHKVNCSILRNNVASLLKAERCDPVRIALHLGHSATATQKAYGRFRYAAKGAGWLAPTVVHGAGQVRVNSTLQTMKAGIVSVTRSRPSQK